MKSFKLITSLFVLIILPFLGANAFGNGNDTGPAVKEARTIEVTGTDRMKFSVTEITARPGEQLHIVFHTESRLPKMAMSHNMVFLKEGTDAEAFANASAMARDNGYIAPEFKDQIIADTPLAGGGETVEITFTVPQEAGSYTYLCSFPGHFLAGMKGVLTVKEPAS